MKGSSAPIPGRMASTADRQTEEQSHLFWAEAALSYTLPKSQQNFYVRLMAGTSVDADRFSAYRLGGYLPLVSEFPLSLPGYYFQEISARQFVLFNANYLLPLDHSQRWNLDVNASTAVVDYLPGTGQPGNSLTGVGGGIFYRAPSDRFKIMLDYAYGVDAMRSHGRGAQQHRHPAAMGFGADAWRRFHPGTSEPLARLAMVFSRLKEHGENACGLLAPGTDPIQLAQNAVAWFTMRDGCAYGGIGRHATLRW